MSNPVNCSKNRKSKRTANPCSPLCCPYSRKNQTKPSQRPLSAVEAAYAPGVTYDMEAALGAASALEAASALFHERGTGRFALTAVDEAGAPVPGVLLMVFTECSLTASGLTGRDGVLLAEGVCPGECRCVLADDCGWRMENELIFPVSANKTAEHTLTLIPHGEAHIRGIRRETVTLTAESYHEGILVETRHISAYPDAPLTIFPKTCTAPYTAIPPEHRVEAPAEGQTVRFDFIKKA